jgi:hypothetical protein
MVEEWWSSGTKASSSSPSAHNNRWIISRSVTADVEFMSLGCYGVRSKEEIEPDLCEERRVLGTTEISTFFSN